MSTSIEIPQGGSPETQEIIDACFKGGSDSWQLLEQRVPARHQQAELALDEFLAQADQQGADFVKAHDAAIQAVESAFGRFHEALDSVLQAVRLSSPEKAKEAGQALAAASFGIRSAVVSFEEGYLSYGDSRFPLVNLLSNLLDRLRNGKLEHSVWQATCQRYGQFFGRSIEEIERSEEQDKPGVPERKVALLRLTELFAKLEKLSSQDPRSQCEDLIFEISGLLVELSEAVESYHAHVFLTGESRSPRMNLILNVCRGTLAGKYDKSILRSLTTSLSDEVQGRLRELHRLSQEPQESEIIADSLADMIDVLESMDDALYSLVQYSKGVQVAEDEIQEALDILRESGDNLGDVNQTVTKFNEKQARVACPSCGFEQQSGRLSCSSCGAAIPEGLSPALTSSFEMSEGTPESQYGEPVMTNVMQELFSRVEDFDAARLGAEEFGEVIEDYHLKIDSSEEKLSQLQAPAMPHELSVEDRAICREFITIAEDALSLLEVGLAECREGLEHLQHFAETREQNSKASGMQLYFDGTQKMWLVSRAQKRVEDFIKASGSLLGNDNSAGLSPSAAPSTSLTSRFQDHLP